MSQLLSTWRGWLFAIFAAALLTACDPIASILLPSVAEVGVEVEFKSELLTQYKADEFQDLQYEWVFGDGTTATGPVVKHAYAQPGDYEVVLNITDAATRPWGQAYVSKAIVKVVPFTGALVPVSVRVYDDQGGSIVGATVSVAGQSALTDEAGGAYVRPNQPALSPVAVIEKDGYITQSVVVPDVSTSERGVVVRLKPKAAAVSIGQIEQAQSIVGSSESLTPTVVLPPQALVNAAGQPVSGEASVRVSPWDITRTADIQAFPGQGRADDGGGKVVDLVSFGMLTIEFEQAGQKLQLAPGKTAVISMDLPIQTDMAGREIKVGDKIPLWHFDEARGLWVREGEGAVVASDTSWTGLGVRAVVGHFSSWNWDVVRDPAAGAVSRKVQCMVPDDQGAVAPIGTDDNCLVSITQTLSNGQVLVADLAVPANGLVYPSFVSSAAAVLQAETFSERRGTASWQVAEAEAAEPLNIVLSQLSKSVPVEGGDVAVVDEQPAVAAFKIPRNDYKIRLNDMKVFMKSAEDGSLKELPVKPFAGFNWDQANTDPDVAAFDLRLYFGGRGALWALSGGQPMKLVVQLPVASNFENDPDTGVWGPKTLTTYEVEASYVPPKFSGPTLVRVPDSLVFAFWDEVGVHSPIANDSLVEVSLSTITGGWQSAPSPWMIAGDASFLVQNDNGDIGSYRDGQFKPYFSISGGCGAPAQNDVVMRVRVTDPATGMRTVFKAGPFVAWYPFWRCT